MVAAMAQEGNIRTRHGAFHLRYYVTEMVGGQPVRRQVTKRLGSVKDYKDVNDKALREKADDILRPLNSKESVPQGRMFLKDFADDYFLPNVLAKKKPSTHKFYKDIINNHLRNSVGDIRLEDFRTVDAQRVLDSIQLSLATLRRVKTTMSALFGYAARLGFVSGSNPVHQSKPEGEMNDVETYAYNSKEVLEMLKKLPDPARVVVATAAFTGLRKSELRGLQWEDYDGSYLHVQRSVWRTHVGKTKTPLSKAKVPVIEPLRKVLDAHKQRPGTSKWIFSGNKKGFALDLDNLVGRVIRPKLGADWKGWKPFRSGIATVLFGLNVPAETVKIILRHSDAKTTQRHYILLKAHKEGAAAMRKLEGALGNVGQVRASAKPTKSKKRPTPA